MKKIYLFGFIELLISLYCLFLPFYFNDLFYLIPIGIILLILGVGILTVKNLTRILNLLFSFIIIIIYLLLFFYLLIIRGYIKELLNPFLTMAVSIHAPIILFNLFAVYFLKINKKNFK